MVLGIPGAYDQQERFMANMFGFPYFKESRHIQIPGGTGGYWYRLIDTPDFNKRDGRQSNFAEVFKLFKRITAEARLQDFIGVSVSLEIVGFGSFQPLADLYKIIFIM